MELTKKIGLRLRQARQAQKLSLAELARRTNSLSKSRISNYEQGIRRMGLEQAQELSRALGTVSATYLLCLDDDAAISRPERELLDRYRQAGAPGKEKILRVAEAEAGYAAGAGGESPDEGEG